MVCPEKRVCKGVADVTCFLSRSVGDAFVADLSLLAGFLRRAGPRGLPQGGRGVSRIRGSGRQATAGAAEV